MRIIFRMVFPIKRRLFNEPYLKKIWEVYGDYDGVALSAMTHKANTPWDIVWNKRGGKNEKYAIIPNDLIKSHYKEKIKLTNERTPQQPAQSAAAQ